MAALEGMTVLDLTQYEAGTVATQYLAWFGANVIKVEPPVGDPGRHVDGPDGDSYYFLSFNNNKRSVVLDLRSDEGRAAFLDLVPQADVVAENFVLGTMERMGLGYDVLRAANPGIIYATLKGFGTTGPYSGYRSYDWVAQASGGAYSVTGEADGPPMKPGHTSGDSGSAMHLAMGILAAYVEKQRTGMGQVVEVSMQETVTSLMRFQLSQRWRFEGAVPRRGNVIGGPSGLFPCAPGGPNDYVLIMIVTTTQWDALTRAMDRPELTVDERFETPQARGAHTPELQAEIASWTRARTKWEAMEQLQAAGVASSAVLDTEDILRNEHLRARGQIITVNHPEKGDFEMLAPPIHLSASDVEVRRAPLLGEHMDEVLGAKAR